MSNRSNRGYRPLKTSTIKSIMKNNPRNEEPVSTAIEELNVGRISPQISMNLSRHSEYDTLNPEEQIRTFIAFLKAAQSRYDENLRRIDEYQQQKTDLDHYAELSDDLNAADGYEYYKKSRNMWRQRRSCKNEAELLKPVIEFIAQNKDTLNQLAQIQGKCRNAKTLIDQRVYTMRTGVLQ